MVLAERSKILKKFENFRMLKTMLGMIGNKVGQGYCGNLVLCFKLGI